MGARFGHTTSLETKQKISNTLREKSVGSKNSFYGKKHTPETLEKIRKARKNQISPFKGKKHTLLSRLQNSVKHRGSLSPNWRGGINPINDSIRKSLKYRLWREKVFIRDNYTCQECGAKSGQGKTIILNADHIKPFSLYPKLRFILSNGRTLCDKCHRKTKTFGWQIYHKRVRLLIGPD